MTESTAPDAKKTSGSWFFGSEKPKTAPKKDIYAGDNEGLWVYLYPNTGLSCYEPAWYSMRVIPVDKNNTRLEYEIHARKGLEESKIQEFITFLRQVEKEVPSLI